MNAGLSSTTIVASQEPAGLLVVIEGPDRVGKSTQVLRLADELGDRGLSICLSREPGGDDVGEALRSLIIGTRVDPWTELFLFLAGRTRHLAAVIEPALGAGQLVLLDRYTPSTLVYQGALIGDEPVVRLAQLPVFRVPNLTILLDRDKPLGALDATDRFEELGVDEWHRRRARYRSFAQRFGWTVVSGEGSEREVTERLLGLLRGKGICS
jgi:dTMP kinase